MPLSQLETDTLSKLFAMAKSVLADLTPRLQALNELYNSVGGMASTLTQAELDEVEALSGLTKQSVDDAVAALTAQVLPGITNAYASLAQCASRFL